MACIQQLSRTVALAHEQGAHLWLQRLHSNSFWLSNILTGPVRTTVPLIATSLPKCALPMRAMPGLSARGAARSRQ